MKAILAYNSLLQTKTRKIIAVEQGKPNPAGSWRADFFKRLLPYATSGKMIRGNLVCFSYEAFAGHKPTQPVVDTAVALELVHSGLLMHDDVMDGDDIRRGQPSLHRQYQTFANRQGLAGPERFGVNMAICGADACLFLALGWLAEAPSSAIQLFSDILVEVCDGQMQDIYSQACPDTPSKRAIYNLMQAKTASYTLSLPLALGAALAGQSPSTIKKLRRLGDVVGVIFQIRDDELGVMGDADKTGKPVGADIREGKKTLIYYYLMKNCEVREKRTLHTIFGNSEITQADVAVVRKLIRQRRVAQSLNADLKHLEKRAVKYLDTLDLPKSYKTEIRSLITFCAKRQT